MTDTRVVPEITDDFVKMHDDYLVPSIFAQWSHHLTEVARIESGHSVLDVACGTGIVTHAALDEVGFSGTVTGLDHNEKMLAAASRKPSRIDWQLGDVAALPFESNSFDRVLCQFALMFIGSRVAAIKEMLRVCKPGGLVTVSVWAPLSQSRGYTALISLIREFAGERAAFRLAAPWSLGVQGKMDALLLSAGVNEYECHERVGVARFPSIDTFVEVHLRSAGIYHDMNKNSLHELFNAAARLLAPFVVESGEIVARLNANIFVLSAD